ncbi:ALS2 C-terminal-like protein [Lacerta agilis]|uniref:ALS2 C-terminal-like protein n=1 Tax=Lacerta agilis TaxID=80427 RepID=UPI0014198650|nr:ALS2 C-terminal-like protein [Lacerta agilis]
MGSPPLRGQVDMSITDVAASLLRTEDSFSACLARINSILLQPLLQSGFSENAKLLAELNDRFQVIWDLTEESYRTLKQTFGVSESVGIQDLYLAQKADLFLDAYIQYFSTFTSCVVTQVFDHAARNKSDFWKTHKPSLQQFLADFSPGTSVAVALHTVLHKPFWEHLQKYSLVFSQLKEAAGQNQVKEVSEAAEGFANLLLFICQALDEANLTRNLWKSLGHKFTDVLCVPERRLLEDSRNLALFPSTGRSDRVLLFNDILVLIQGNTFQSFDLKLTWVDASFKETGKHTLRITTPEGMFFLLAKEPESRAVWQWKLNQAVRQALSGKRDFPLWGEAGRGRDPPVCRCCSFNFREEGRFKGATYEGEWRLSKPHGKGTLTWPDGRNYVGDFQDGMEHGFGICLVPRASEDRYDCYKCHWREGKMNGYGICEYGDEMVYKGYFKDNVRQGFGTLENPSDAEKPFKYSGHWENDKKHGYGVWDDKERGERYIGMWQEDQRHGPGLVLMQSGVCYQRTFHMDKMVGSGTLLLEDDSIFVGNFTRDLTFVGKGKLTFPNGFILEGTFSSKSTHGLQTQGVLDTSGDQQDDTAEKLQLGLEVFPVEKRWEGLCSPFLEFVHSGGQGETEEAFMGFHVQTSKELRKSQEYLFCHRGTDETPRKVDYLEELVEHQEKVDLQDYLHQALQSSLHPLGKFLKALTLAFQASYSGIGANKHLLSMAQQEIKHYAKKIWEFYQGLLRLALEVKGQPSAEDMEESDLNGPALVLPLILPCFYPDLSMLYMLYHQKEDDLYCQGIMDLSLFPDVKLLEFLEVQKYLWPLKDLTLTSNQRRSLVKDRCFLSATECLQKLITTVDPREKLDILQKTYEEIEKTVNRVLEKEYSLPMDDLLPLLMYVVTRASIQHLGAEIHLIRDLMDSTNEGGMYDFLLTALESCYNFIQKEIRLRPSWQVLHNS